MNRHIVSAVFDSRMEAERALTELRSEGISDGAISVIARHDDSKTVTETTGEEHHEHDADSKGSGIAKGVGVGAGVGALFGLSALLIPGVGPFIAAGTLVEGLGAIGSSVATGAIVGGTAGGISALLMKYGVSEEDANYYEERIRQGGVFVSVDTDKARVEEERVRSILHRFGGHSASHRREATV